MTPIAAFDPALASGPSLDRVQPSPSTAPAVPTPIANPPAVIVSLSGVASAGNVTSTGGAKLPEGNPDEINRTLGAVSGANDFLGNYNRFDWAAAAKEFGPAKANADKARLLATAQGANTYAAVLSSRNSAVPVQSLGSTDVSKPGVPPRPITVGDFSFNHNGSVYAITHMKSGLTVGTKDGQYWNAWALDGALTSPDGHPIVGVSMAKSDPLNIVT